MIFFKTFRFFLIFVLLPGSFCHAFFKKGDAGQEVFSFISSFQSPRNAALERSNAALPSSDPGIIFLNPAGFAGNSKTNQVAFHWQTGEFAENQGALTYARSLSRMKFLFSYGWIREGSIDGYDEFGEPTGETHEPASHLFATTFSFPFTCFSFGSTIKFATDQLSGKAGDQTAMALAFDWGISYQPATPRFGLALTARDFGSMIRDYTDDGGEENYAMGQTFALSAFFRPATLPRLTLLGETTFPRYSEPALLLGGEYIFGKSFFARVGFTRAWLDLSRDVKELFGSRSRPDESNDARFLSAGIGYEHSLFALDYAFSYLTQGLGMEHRIGLRFGF